MRHFAHRIVEFGSVRRVDPMIEHADIVARGERGPVRTVGRLDDMISADRDTLRAKPDVQCGRLSGLDAKA